MTLHDKERYVRALCCDWNSRDSLVDALRGLQSTDDPSLVPLHDLLLKRLEQLEQNPGEARPSELTSRIVEGIARTIETACCAFDGGRPVDGFYCTSCSEGLPCERTAIASLLRSPLVKEVVASILHKR